METTDRNKKLLAVALRYNAIFADVDRKALSSTREISRELAAFLLSLSEKGYVAEEDLLAALKTVPESYLGDITEAIDTALGINLNWMPLVRGWDTPTGESFIDHCITFYANFLGGRDRMTGTTLPCGHFIPDGTFPLERYNGCPFCGTPFKTSNYVYKGQGSKKKSLRLMTLQDLENLRLSLLESAVPLDGTQAESLKTLIVALGLPEGVEIGMKETRMYVVDALVQADRAEAATPYLTSPADILRYLWYKKTKKTQILEPKVLIKHAGKLNSHMWPSLDKSQEAEAVMRQNLKLKYDRKTCRTVAQWLNALEMDADEACEIMHPKRGMWVRMIRELRLGEYSRKPGYERLNRLLDTFYKDDYSVWKGQLDKALGINCGCVDYSKALTLLKQRPGTFARSLFSTMLRLGPNQTIQAFKDILDKVPPRLVLSLANAADLYFDIDAQRIARPLTGSTKSIPYNKKLDNFTPEQRESLKRSVWSLYKDAMTSRFQKEDLSSTSGKIFIDKALYDIPVSVGDRSSSIQDASAALQGTRFQVEGDAVRLFMQWGVGLKAQHLDMDLSVAICYKDGHREDCGYFNLSLPGAKHSGDIRNIPDQVGTAEYIELSIPELKNTGAKYVAFSCNAYSHGAISPNLMVGWMNSANPMTISNETGVAYDPSTVQHIVRISEGNLEKGLVFGVLDIDKREITWLEMPFTAQVVGKLDTAALDSLLRRLKNKLKVGELLQLKAQAQNLTITDTQEDADPALRYTYTWALDAAAVSRLLG
ncbi:MAG: hypothetical protein IKS82_08330 [Bacteroidales bacterium]|nr:hypothetical protein [Bacteroidales bacterium]